MYAGHAWGKPLLPILILLEKKKGDAEHFLKKGCSPRQQRPEKQKHLAGGDHVLIGGVHVESENSALRNAHRLEPVEQENRPIQRMIPNGVRSSHWKLKMKSIVLSCYREYVMNCSTGE